ncbi:MAG: pyridoxal phosphate-dependent aminotransferase [Proteobacteria bacterium]|nr:pyridoxal phosphate-dependent aminotransferase [Burkholderiales bacterium]
MAQTASLIAERMNRIKPSPSSAASARVRELQAQGRDIVGLTTGEPDFPTPDHIKQAAIRALETDQTRYTNPDGTVELKTAVQGKFKRENGLDYALDQIIVSAGSKQSLFNALLATIEDGDEVIIPAPFWVSYIDMVLLAGGRPVVLSCLEEHGFKLQAEQLERALTPRTKWVMFCSPNNPSGATYTATEMKELARVLLPHPKIHVISDDIYEHLIYDGRTFATMAQVEPALYERTLTVNGVSKAYSMTGWRLGYAGGPRELIRNMAKLQSQSTTNPSSISQFAAIAALDGPQEFIAERCRAFQHRRDVVVGLLNRIPGISCRTPEGAFYVFPSCAGLMGRRTPAGDTLKNDRDVILYFLDEAGVGVLQGDVYGMSPYFRISTASDLPMLEEGCRRIALAVDRLSS